MTDSNFKFIIIGAGRGGTSLLMGLLDYHSRLEVFNEYASISNLMGRDFQCETDEIIQQRIITFITLCKSKASVTPDKICGNKITTEQLYALEEHNIENPDAKIDVFDVFFNQYLKNYKKIFILRDGRACVNSKVKRTGRHSMEAACERWKYSVSVYKYLQTCDDTINIKFEDLLFHPEMTLQKVSKFLGVIFEKNMLNGVSNKKLIPVYQNTHLMIEKTNTIDFPDKYLALIKDDLAYCNYK